jgi:exonuclease VII small subunit
MTTLLTVNYKEVLQPKTVEFIEEGEYDLDDALKFIDEYNEDAQEMMPSCMKDLAKMKV